MNIKSSVVLLLISAVAFSDSTNAIQMRSMWGRETLDELNNISAQIDSGAQEAEVEKAVAQVKANHDAADARAKEGLAKDRATAEKQMADLNAAHEIYEQTQEAKIAFHEAETERKNAAMEADLEATEQKFEVDDQ